MEVIAFPQLIKFAAALLFVLALMGGLALVMRKINGSHPITIPHKRRLKITESLTISPKHKAVLIKRDNKEHLVILGANSELLVESDIESQQNADIVAIDVNEKKNEA